MATARSRLPAIRSRPASARASSGSYSDDVLADRRVDLGDAVAHQPGAGDEDPLDRHRGEPTALRAARGRLDGRRPRDEQRRAEGRDAAETRNVGRVAGRRRDEAEDAGARPNDEVQEQRSSVPTTDAALVWPTRGDRERDDRREHERDPAAKMAVPTSSPRPSGRGR